MNLRDILYPEGAVCVACGALHARDAQWSLCETCEAALSLLQGPRCPGCGGPGEGLCRRCRARGPGSLDAVTAAFAYTGTARLLVRALKYDGVHTAARALAAGMFRVRPKTPFDAIVPVPLHRWRERSRGFNQAETLSRLLGEAMGLPVLPLLTRARRTGTQTRLTASERAGNVEGAFAASGRGPWPAASAGGRRADNRRHRGGVRVCAQGRGRAAGGAAGRGKGRHRGGHISAQENFFLKRVCFSSCFFLKRQL